MGWEHYSSVHTVHAAAGSKDGVETASHHGRLRTYAEGLEPCKKLGHEELEGRISENADQSDLTLGAGREADMLTCV